MKQLTTAILFLLFFCPSAEAYKALTDATNGGNPKLQKKVYKVYIQSDPTNNNRDQEVKNALAKWQAEFAAQNVTLQLQQGSPPQTPFDLKKFNDEVKKFNETPNPNDADFPEIQKFNDKQCTINIYFETTAEIINRGGGGSERGLAKNVWNFDSNGQADKIEFSDVFLPTDPPGGAEEVKKRIIHNIAMHEIGHVGGMDHYTPAQQSKGDIMETDATLHSTKLDLSEEEKKALKTFYGKKSKVKVESEATNQQSSSLPSNIQDLIPDELDNVWEYNYDLAWLEGSPVSYFQVEVGDSPIFFASGGNGFDDWQFELPDPDERFFEFFADSNYLGEDVFEGSLQFYSSAPPGNGWLVYSGGGVRGLAPVPEPATLLLLGGGLVAAFRRRKI